MNGVTLGEFADKLSQILPLIMREFLRRQVQELGKGSITMQQFLVMEFLNYRVALKMHDLATFMAVSMASMTGIVERLVRDGYAERRFEPSDRRIVKVVLTQKGTAMVKKILQRRRDMIVDVFGQISQADRQDYLRILSQVKDILTIPKKA